MWLPTALERTLTQSERDEIGIGTPPTLARLYVCIYPCEIPNATFCGLSRQTRALKRTTGPQFLNFSHYGDEIPLDLTSLTELTVTDRRDQTQ